MARWPLVSPTSKCRSCLFQEPIAALLQGRDSLRLALFDLELPSSILKRPAEAEIGLEQTAASSWTAGDVKAGLPLAVVGTPFAAAAHEYLQDAVYHARVSKSLSESGVPLVLLVSAAQHLQDSPCLCWCNHMGPVLAASAGHGADHGPGGFAGL